MIKIKRFKIIILTCLIFMTFSSTSLLATENKIDILINDTLVVVPKGDQEPFVEDGRTYVPLRIIGENLGYSVEFDKNRIFINIDGNDFKKFENPATDLKVYINNEELKIPENYGRVFISKKDRTVIPLRIVAEALGTKVEWVPGLVVIEKNKNSSENIEDSKDNEDVEINSSDDSKIEDDFTGPFDFDRPETITIFGDSMASKKEIQRFLDEEEKRIRVKMIRSGREFHEFPEGIVDAYLKIGDEYGIRGDIALCQALKETGYFQFTGDVEFFQNNYCGLWATGNPLTGDEETNGVDTSKVFFIKGMHGLTFATPELGVEAHIQHLYAYASAKPLPKGKELLDPRFNYVNRGNSKFWVDLNGKWAVPGVGYGESIIQNYYAKIFE